MGVVSHDDWSLDRRGQQAQARHKEKVKKAIKENLRGIIADEGLIVSAGKKTIRIPVQSLDEPHFHFNREQQQHTGQGEGENGQVIGRAKPQPGQGQGMGAGNEPGETVFEAEITLDDIEAALFSNLRLPNLRPKTTKQLTDEEEEWTDVRNKGIQSNLDRKRTFFEALRRSQTAHQPLRITPDDLRFKTWEDHVRPQTGAVILAMMDVSGSMGEFEKFVARTFFFWTERFLQKHYPQVVIRYLVHHTEAYEVNSADFYRIRENGGTRCSSVYELAAKLCEADYPEEEWNLYPIHVSDGDNISDDNAKAVQWLQKLNDRAAMVSYLEVHSRQTESTLQRELRKLHSSTLRTFTVLTHEEILSALQHFFREEDVS